MTESSLNHDSGSIESEDTDIRTAADAGSTTIRRKVAGVVILVMVGVCIADFGTQDAPSTENDSMADLDLFLQDLDTAPADAMETTTQMPELPESSADFELTIPDGDSIGALSVPVVHPAALEHSHSDESVAPMPRIHFTGSIQSLP